jgi:hypothetical protein
MSRLGRYALGAFAGVAVLAGCAAPLSPGAAPSIVQRFASGPSPVTRARREHALYFFAGAPDGDLPSVGRLTFDRAGNLYGSTSTGGTGKCEFRGFVTGCGTIFELSPSASGDWAERVLYGFKNLRDGAAPYGTLDVSAAGKIYGVTTAGGNRGCVPLFWVYHGCGTVFELVRSGNRWAKRTLHVFSGGIDGGNPLAGLVLDSAGRLYGTAYCGGAFYSCYSEGAGAGVFFELKPSKSGSWDDVVLHSFGRHLNDGAFPLGDLTVDGDGDIYGTAENVFEMKRSSSMRWRYRQLIELGNNAFAQGYHPNGGLAFDTAGNIYGTMATGGNVTCNCGLVFEVARSPSGDWSETVLHTFSGGSDGGRAQTGLTIDSAGRLYGTTPDGGDVTCNNGGGCGLAFELYPNGSSSRERILHTFRDDATDGGMPESMMIFDKGGNLYGTTMYGGPGPNLGPGSVFEIFSRPSGAVRFGTPLRLR